MLDNNDNAPWGFLKPNGSLGVPPFGPPNTQADPLLTWLQSNGVVRLADGRKAAPEATDEPVVTMGRPIAPQGAQGIRVLPEDGGTEPQDAPDDLLMATLRQRAQAHAENEAWQAQANADAQGIAEAEQAKRISEGQQPPYLSTLAQVTLPPDYPRS